jgi:hypothetical protein
VAYSNPERQQEPQDEWPDKRVQVVVGLVVAVLVVAIVVLIWKGTPSTNNPQAIREVMSRMISQIKNMPGAETMRTSLTYMWSSTALMFASLAILGVIISKVFDKMCEYGKYFRRNWLDFIQYWGASLIALLVFAYIFGLIAEHLFHIALSP